MIKRLIGVLLCVLLNIATWSSFAMQDQITYDSIRVTILTNDSTLGRAYDTIVRANTRFDIDPRPIGYNRFICWGDQDFNYWRLIHVGDRDTTFTAYYARSAPPKHQTSLLHITSSNPQLGIITVDVIPPIPNPVFDNEEVLPSDMYVYANYTKLLLTAVPAEGCMFLEWCTSVEPYDFPIDSISDTIDVSRDETFTAKFDSIRYYNLDVVSSNEQLGSVSGSGVFLSHVKTRITATPEEGAWFRCWSDGDTLASRIVQVKHDFRYIAIFDTVKHYSITIATSDDYLGIATGTGFYPKDSLVTITAIPRTGSRFVAWSDGNTEPMRTITVTQAENYTAIFEPVWCILTVVSASPEMGSVKGTIVCRAGDVVEIAAIPFDGYRFMAWDDGDKLPTRRVRVTEDVTYTAMFALQGKCYVTIKAEDASMGTTYGSGVYASGTNVQLKAMPYAGYLFAEWSDGYTQPQRGLFVESDTVVIARFIVDTNYVDTFAVNIRSRNETVVFVNLVKLPGGVETYIAATPAEHYHFLRWTDGNTENPRSVVLYSDTTFTAECVIDSVLLMVEVNDETMGRVDGSGIYPYGTRLVLTAIPEEGYTFVCWENGETSRTRIVYLEEAVLCQATFAERSDAINNVAHHSPQVIGGKGVVVIKQALHSQVGIFDVAGRRVVSPAYINEEEQYISVPHKGIYIVQLNNSVHKIYVR